VAYSLQRAVLQSGPNSPSLLLTEPIIGIGKIDAADMIDPALEDDPAGLQAAPAADLLAACESVTSRIVADDAAGTVTVTLAQPYGPFMVTLAHTVASIVDKEWAVTNGVWDGDCATWQKFYGLIQENDPIAEMANGTGPYKLVSWDHATKTVTLEAFDGYWRTEPLWEGAKTGVASVKTVLIKGIDEWGTRFSMLQAGDADFAVVNRANISQVDPLTGERADYDVATETFGEMKPTENPSAPLRLFFGAPALSRSDILMNENVKVNVDEGSPFIGTASTKSGRGIPVDFFANEHVRKAMNYCMDWDTYIKDYLLGEGQRVPYTLALPGELGFNASDPMYAYDPAKCEEEFKLAEFTDGTVWDTGFYFVGVWNTGNTARKTALEILSASLLAVNGKFSMSVLGMPWAAELRYYQAGKLPMYMIGWQEDIHDPHNWYSPYLVGTYGVNANFPEAVYADFKSFVDRGAAATDPAERTAIYTELNAKVFAYAPFINGPLTLGRHYEQRWISGYYYNPLYGGFYYYELGKN
ncbi:MAG: ABC transporter substrate-binding protein, partial [Anaerolineaceae bacterium]